MQAKVRPQPQIMPSTSVIDLSAVEYDSAKKNEVIAPKSSGERRPTATRREKKEKERRKGKKREIVPKRC